VIDHSRYQLDYRNPEVRAYADSVVARLVREYGVGYIKMDYNIDVTSGTDFQADSPGEGLLGHNRAYLGWLDSVFERFPDLVIENCGSGGMRMEYSLLSRHSIQSVTDQTDYLKMASIAAAAPSAVTPEQSAIWSYPLRDAGREAVAFNMINAMLQRVHQSGPLNELPPPSFELVAEGIAVYKAIRPYLAEALPFWPLGLPDFNKRCVCLGMRHESSKRAWLAVWNVHEPRGFELSVPLGNHFATIASAKVLYPGFASADDGVRMEDPLAAVIRMGSAGSARLIELVWR
jgi:alpha-galactosidase